MTSDTGLASPFLAVDQHLVEICWVIRVFSLLDFSVQRVAELLKVVEIGKNEEEEEGEEKTRPRKLIAVKEKSNRGLQA